MASSKKTYIATIVTTSYMEIEAVSEPKAHTTAARRLATEYGSSRTVEIVSIEELENVTA
jgi:hypothetical protein